MSVAYFNRRKYSCLLTFTEICVSFTSLFLSSPVHSQPSFGHLIAIERTLLSVALSGKMSLEIITVILFLRHQDPDRSIYKVTIAFSS